MIKKKRHSCIEKKKKKDINDFENSEKNEPKENINLSIRDSRGKYFSRQHNSKRIFSWPHLQLNGLPWTIVDGFHWPNFRAALAQWIAI